MDHTNKQSPNQSPPQPVAYDQEGRPLYAHPPQTAPAATPQTAPAATPQTVYVTRPHEPNILEISPEVKAKHDKSVTDYPMLNLSPGEYVIKTIRRHPIGLITIWGTALLLMFLVGLMLLVLLFSEQFGIRLAPEANTMAIMFVVGLMTLIFLGGYIAAHVYKANRFYLTNESVIQHIQNSLFSKREQTISLGSIEDASFRQHGIMPHFFNYGSLRLSTEGEETTYRFNYTSDPREQVAMLNDAVEAFKNGRPVRDTDQD